VALRRAEQQEALRLQREQRELFQREREEMAREKGATAGAAPHSATGQSAPTATAAPVVHESIRNIAANDNRKKMLFDPPPNADADGGIVIHVPSKASLFAPATPTDRAADRTRDGSRAEPVPERTMRSVPIRQAVAAKPSAPVIFSSPVEVPADDENEGEEEQEGYYESRMRGAGDGRGHRDRSPRARNDEADALVRKLQQDAERAKEEAQRAKQGEGHLRKGASSI
jgi:hypothetical protein